MALISKNFTLRYLKNMGCIIGIDPILYFSYRVSTIIQYTYITREGRVRRNKKIYSVKKISKGTLHTLTCGKFRKCLLRLQTFSNLDLIFDKLTQAQYSPPRQS